MSRNGITIQTISIVLIVIAVLVSSLSLNYVMPLSSRIEAMEKQGNKLSDDVRALRTSIEGIKSAVDQLALQPSPTPPPPPPVTPTKTSLRIGYTSAPRSLDPPDYNDDFLNPIDQLVHEPLFRMEWGPNNEITLIPVLVDTFQQVDDLTWVFTLKKGIYFSDGTELDSQDVYWSLWRSEPRPPNMIWSLDARIKSIEKVDKYTLRMVTKYPMNNLDWWLCQGWTNIVSYDWVIKTGNSKTYPMSGMPPGTGPYMWTEFEPMMRAKMELNPFWRGKPPKITEIEIFEARDDSARAMAMEAGAFDFINPTVVEAVPRLKAAGLKVVVKPTPIIQQIEINNAFAPTNNLKVRQAIAYAIKYDELIPRIWGEYALRVRTAAPALTIGYKDFPLYDYNPTKAKQLLTEAGFTEGLKLKMVVISGREKLLEAASAIKTYLAAVGIDLEIVLMESATISAITSDFRSRWLKGEMNLDFPYHLRLRGWHADTLWAGDDLFSLYHSAGLYNN